MRPPKSLLVVFAVLAMATTARPIRSSQAADQESQEPTLQSGASSPQKSGPLKLIATDVVFPDEGFTLVPANPTVAETLETGNVVSVVIPEDKKRTHLFVAVSGAHSWHQIPSTAPYRLTGSYRISLTSSALPSPGQFSFGVGLAGQVESQPSAADITRFFDPASSFGLDEKALVPLLRFNFPTLTDGQLLDLARDLLRSEIKMEMKVRVRMRSVDDFTLSNAVLQVWGD
jgi:hypothetical protein